MIKSLRHRLLLILLVSVFLTWSATAAMTYFFAQSTVSEQVNRHLKQYMNAVDRAFSRMRVNSDGNSNFFNSLTYSSSEDVNKVEVAEFNNIERGIVTNIWMNGNLIPLFDMPQFDTPIAEGIETQTHQVDGELRPWRVMYRFKQDQNTWIAVGVDLHQIAPGGLTSNIIKIALPLLLVLPIIFILLWLGIVSGLRPLRKLARKVASRNPASLEPIEEQDAPTEVQPVVTEINDLLHRLKRALDSEASFTSNAAHELQTPLASIKAEVQRHQQQASSEETRYILDRIASRVTRAAETVTQLLTLARLDPDQSYEQKPICLDRLVLDVIADQGNLALDKHIDLQLGDQTDVVIYGHAELLNILISNLLINAFKYSPENGEVTVSWSSLGDTVHFTVTNDCQVIPGEAFEKLTDRFYTLPGKNQSGVGLGLAIVQRIASLHNAELSLSPKTDASGFRAEVIFRT